MYLVISLKWIAERLEMEPWTCVPNLLLGDAFHPGSMPHGSKHGAVRTGNALVCAGLLLLGGARRLPADQVELRTGDRYVGQVLSVDTNSVVVQSEVLGRVRLPRSKVAVITLGRVAATNSPARPLGSNAALSGAATNAALKGPLALKGMKVNTNVVQQVQKQFLDGAGDEANAKFNELLGGLLTGKLSVDDIRAQAKAAADQLRALQRESGEGAGFDASAYLAILDHFLKESAPPGLATNATRSMPKPKPKAEPEEDNQ
jgi:hypothetical protein